jgi:hypothetical protein
MIQTEKNSFALKEGVETYLKQYFSYCELVGVAPEKWLLVECSFGDYDYDWDGVYKPVSGVEIDEVSPRFDIRHNGQLEQLNINYKQANFNEVLQPLRNVLPQEDDKFNGVVVVNTATGELHFRGSIRRSNYIPVYSQIAD